jgi:ATP-binding cassette subfamily F protein 3
MLRLTKVSVARGARVLYRDASLVAAPGERVGLVGANGCGKSSLFAAILGELSLEAGTIDAPAPERIAHVAQDIDTEGTTALEYVLQGHAPLAAAQAALAAAEAGSDDLELAHAHAHLAEIDPGAVMAQALTVMRGLGFAPDAGQQPMASFSGGWRNRLALCRALLRPAELLLLDEPTNHLDLDSVVWLENWLRRQAATVLVISHDREFLDRCVGTIWHVGDATIRRYAGDYSAFETARLERSRQQDAQARTYQRTAAHLQQFVDRFRAQATKARQAQSRLKMLQRLVEVEPSRAEHEWRFEFPQPRKLPERLIDASGLDLGYGDPRAGAAPVLRGVRLVVEAGDRIGILGVNGAGKSTLVKAITGALAPMAGQLQRGSGVAIGYFAQHQLDQLAGDETPLEQLRRLAPQTREQELRDFLGTYRFSGEMATAKIGRMSGGEKARCALALLAWQRPNLLVLDEPTNHLDMETREALTMALSSFEGALLLVSHDRHLLRATADQLWLVHDGTVGPFDGDLDQYTAFVLASRRERNERSDRAAGAERSTRNDRSAASERHGRGERGEPAKTGNRIEPNAPNANRDPAQRKEDKRLQAQQRERQAQARRPLQQRLQKIERDLEGANAELKQIDQRLADPAFYHAGDTAEVATVLKQRAIVSDRVAKLEAQWLQGQEDLDKAPA